MRKFAWTACFMVVLGVWACDNKEGEGDTKVTDTAQADVQPDTAPQDTSEDQADDALNDQQSDSLDPEYGFQLRSPKQDYNIQCEGTDWEGNPGFFEGADADWMCSFDYNGEVGRIYVQATPTSCVIMMSVLPEYTTKVWLSLGDAPVAMEKPGYDFGGNHMNNSFWFTYDGKKFTYDHSSFGFGFRCCQPVDCIRVAEAAGTPVLEDGCTKERTLPVVCVPVKADGTYDDLVDTFKPCNGDPNYATD